MCLWTKKKESRSITLSILISVTAPQRPAAKVAPKMAPGSARRPGSSGDEERAELIQEVSTPALQHSLFPPAMLPLDKCCHCWSIVESEPKTNDFSFCRLIYWNPQSRTWRRRGTFILANWETLSSFAKRRRARVTSRCRGSWIFSMPQMWVWGLIFLLHHGCIWECRLGGL